MTADDRKEEVLTPLEAFRLVRDTPGLNNFIRLLALLDVEERLRECPDERLMAARELLIKGGETNTIIPLLNRRAKGRKPKPGQGMMIGLVAAVDVIAKGRKGVDDVVAEVARAAGVTHKELKNYRQRWQRGRIDPTYAYLSALVTFEKMTKAEILTEIKARKKVRKNFVPNPH